MDRLRQTLSWAEPQNKVIKVAAETTHQTVALCVTIKKKNPLTNTKEKRWSISICQMSAKVLLNYSWMRTLYWLLPATALLIVGGKEEASNFPEFTRKPFCWSINRTKGLEIGPKQPSRDLYRLYSGPVNGSDGGVTEEGPVCSTFIQMDITNDPVTVSWFCAACPVLFLALLTSSAGKLTKSRLNYNFFKKLKYSNGVPFLQWMFDFQPRKKQ